MKKKIEKWSDVRVLVPRGPTVVDKREDERKKMTNERLSVWLVLEPLAAPSGGRARRTSGSPSAHLRARPPLWMLYFSWTDEKRNSSHSLKTEKVV